MRVTPTVQFATPERTIADRSASVSPVTQEPTFSASSTLSPSPTPSAGLQLPLKGLKICIDPGHQGIGNREKEPCAPWNDLLKAKCTSGACGNFTGVDEHVTTLAISQKIKTKLTALGAEVLLTRESPNVDLSNKERAEMANRFGADITLRIHCNSADSADAEGIELYVRDAGDGSAAYQRRSDEDYRKAAPLLDALCAETGARSRGLKKSDAYTGINWCEHTCIIVECGFLSNEKEDRLLQQAAYQDKIAEGIKNYFVSCASFSS